MSTKHPWEYKQEVIKDKASKEEFQELIDKIKNKEKEKNARRWMLASKGKLTHIKIDS